MCIGWSTHQQASTGMTISADIISDAAVHAASSKVKADLAGLDAQEAVTTELFADWERYQGQLDELLDLPAADIGDVPRPQQAIQVGQVVSAT